MIIPVYNTEDQLAAERRREAHPRRPLLPDRVVPASEHREHKWLQRSAVDGKLYRRSCLEAHAIQWKEGITYKDYLHWIRFGQRMLRSLKPLAHIDDDQFLHDAVGVILLRFADGKDLLELKLVSECSRPMICAVPDALPSIASTETRIFDVTNLVQNRTEA